MCEADTTHPSIGLLAKVVQGSIVVPTGAIKVCIVIGIIDCVTRI